MILTRYADSTIVAEKYEAMTVFGIANSRMKDYYDLWTIAKTFPFQGNDLKAAIDNTFARRNTPPAEQPVALSADFATNPIKNEQWRGFLRRSNLTSTPLPDVIDLLQIFLLPPTSALLRQEPFTHQ